MKPILKWVGGKTQLLNILKSKMPIKYNKYIEPFIGGGALFFDISPSSAIINDFNTELISLYKVIKDNQNEFISTVMKYQEEFNSLSTYDERSNYYYKCRDKFNKNIKSNNLSVDDASLLLFLNKLCFNGLYRVNKDGFYNASYNKLEKVELLDINNCLKCSELLQNTTILCGDFYDSCKDAEQGDFVYFDPPYYDTFVGYKSGGFSEEDNQRLYKLFCDLTNKGVYCMLSNGDSDYIKELYKDFNIYTVDVRRFINCDASNRKGKEVIITNYSTELWDEFIV